MRFVHCFTRVPGSLGALVYPHELNVPEPYQGHSTLALMGNDYADLADGYMFLAMLRGKILPVHLKRIEKTKTYVAEVNGVGKFRFRAIGIAPLPFYAGNYLLPGPRYAPYYLSTADHEALDAVVRSSDFYFAGFSPVLEDADDYPFR